MAELLNKIDSRELSEWMAFYQLEPFGEWRDDYRAGMISATLANINRGKDTKPYDVQRDFMPFYPQDTPRNKATELRASLGHLVKNKQG